MKTTNLTKLARTCAVATALILIGGSIASITAADVPSGKGAAKLLMKPVAPPVVAASASMSCSKCIDKFTSVRDASVKGANKPLTLVAQHECGGCSTVINTVGVGKSKQNIALHTCASGVAQSVNCCARN